jgi:hypothetical protein
MNKSIELKANELLPLASTIGITNEQFREEIGFNHDDDRAKAANTICKLFYQKHGGRLNAVCEDLDFKELYDFFDDYVRNIYEVNHSIPLFCYCYHYRDLHTDDAEHALSLRAVIEACIALYEPIAFSQL